MSLSQVHDSLARASVIFSLLIGIYGLWRYARQAGVDSNFWGILAAGEVLYVAQVVIGLVLLLSGLQPASGRTGAHALYGVLLVLVLPAAYGYTRGRDGRREVLVYALLGLFLAGVSLRAIITAG